MPNNNKRRRYNNNTYDRNQNNRNNYNNRRYNNNNNKPSYNPTSEAAIIARVATVQPNNVTFDHDKYRIPRGLLKGFKNITGGKNIFTWNDEYFPLDFDPDKNNKND